MPSRCAKCCEQADPWADLEINLERARRWHPLNRGLWVGARVTLAGHLLQAKGDRVAMHSSVEVRYPFLDEEVFDFPAKLHPRWKLRGFRDKHLLRLLAERWLPPEIYTPAQGDLPRAAGQLPHGPGAAVRRPALERRIAAAHRLLRCRGGAPLAEGLSPDAAPVRCRVSPWRWAWPPWWPPSSGITPSSMARWRICRRGRAPA